MIQPTGEVSRGGFFVLFMSSDHVSPVSTGCRHRDSAIDGSLVLFFVLFFVLDGSSEMRQFGIIWHGQNMGYEMIWWGHRGVRLVGWTWGVRGRRVSGGLDTAVSGPLGHR
jgi:hypothetical protein